MHHEPPMLLPARENQESAFREPLGNIGALQEGVYHEALALSKVAAQFTAAEKLNVHVASVPPERTHSFRQQVQTFSPDQLTDVNEAPFPLP